MRIGKLLRELRDKRGWPQEKAARQLEITQSYYCDLENDKYLPVKSKTIEKLIGKIEKVYQVKRSYIQKYLGLSNVSQEPQPLRTIPILNSIPAGKLIDYTDYGYPVGWANDYMEVDSGVKDPSAFGLTVEGDSMKPVMVPGDQIVVSPNTEVQNGDYAVVAIDNRKTVKKILFKKDHILLLSENPNYEPIVLNPDEKIKIIGKVIRVFKKF